MLKFIKKLFSHKNNSSPIKKEINIENVDIPSDESLNSHGAHSQVRRGISDYGDGGNVTHYLGNDENRNLQGEDAFSSGNPNVRSNGSVALGNNLKDDKKEENDSNNLYH